MQNLLSLARAIDRALHAIAMAAGWLFVVTVAVIVIDVLTRKLGYQIPEFGSTRLQELEWHLHTALFCFWLGVAYLRNAHVRIDILTAHRPQRTRARMELIGLLVFAIPYCLVAIYFSYDFTQNAWQFNEASDSATGLPWRWIPKGIITIGLVLLLVAVASVLMRLVVHLWGPPALRSAAMFPPEPKKPA